MRLKWLVWSLLIVIAYLCWYFYPKSALEQVIKQPAVNEINPQSARNTQNLNEELNPKESIKLGLGKKDQAAKKSAINQLDQWVNALNTQLSVPKYSEDAVVEFMSIGFEYEGCGNQDNEWFFENKTLSDRQYKLKATAENRCAQLATEYPFLNEKQYRFILNKMGSDIFPATTALGQFIQKHYQPDTIIDVHLHQQNLITLALQAGNAQMLMSAELISSFGRPDLNLAKSILGNTNQPYFKTLNSIALTALSCEFNNGITCTPSAKFMAHKCYAQEQYCGLNFQQWYQQSTTPGVARDVELLKQHYLNTVEL